MPGTAMKHETTRLFRYGGRLSSSLCIAVDGCCSAVLSPRLVGVCTPYRYHPSMTATRYHVPVEKNTCRTIRFRMHRNGH